MKSDDSTPRDPNQGEGDRIAARRYSQRLRDFVAGGKVEPAARAAEDYVERMPEDAARAERKARLGPHTRVSVDELVAKGRTVYERVRPVVVRMIGRIRARLARRSLHS